jgi:hypothetical protein
MKLRGIACCGAWKKPGMREARPHDLAPRRLAAVDAEAHGRGRAHLDRGAAALRVALRVVPVADRVERAVDGDRHEELRPLGQLFHVRVAAVLARRNRAQALGRRLALRRHGARRVRRKHPPATRLQLRFARRPAAQLLVRRRYGPPSP